MTYTNFELALRSEFKYGNQRGYPNRELEAYYIAARAIRKTGAVLGGPKKNWRRALRRVRKSTNDCVIATAGELEAQVYTWLDAMPPPVFHTQWVSFLKRQRRKLPTANARRLCSMEHKFRKDLVRIWASSPRNLLRNLPSAKRLESDDMDACTFEGHVDLPDAVKAPVPVLDHSVLEYHKSFIYVPDAFKACISGTFDRAYFTLRVGEEAPPTPCALKMLQDYVRASFHTEVYERAALRYALVFDVASLDRTRALLQVDPACDKWRIVVLNDTLAAQAVSDAIADFDEDEHVLFFPWSVEDFEGRWHGPAFDLIAVQDVLPVSMLKHAHDGTAFVMSSTKLSEDTLLAFGAEASARDLFLHSGIHLPLLHETHVGFALCKMD